MTFKNMYQARFLFYFHRNDDINSKFQNAIVINIADNNSNSQKVGKDV